MSDFPGGPLLDRDFPQPVPQRPIDARRGCCDVKRHVVVVRGQGFQVGADFVADVSGGGRAVSADDDEIDVTVLHQVTAGVVGDDSVGYAVIEQLPSGEAGALVTRPSFIDPDMDRDAGVMCGVQRSGCGADVDGGEPAGVAMCEHVDACAGRLACGDGPDEWQAGDRDTAVEGDVFIAQVDGELARRGRACAGGEGGDVGAHAVQRPAQIDGGRAGGEEGGVGVGEGGVRRIRAECEPQAPRRGGTDQRGPAHQHRTDGVGRIIEGGEASGDERVR